MKTETQPGRESEEARKTAQIKRITRYEKLMDEILAVLGRQDASREELLALRGKVRRLAAYYEGPAWKQDFADDEAGLLPLDLKRGVLSEDGVFDLLDEYREALSGKS